MKTTVTIVFEHPQIDIKEIKDNITNFLDNCPHSYKVNYQSD